ncbi:MAG: hypothetical protein ACM3S1_07090 [Hyphomicrobiales bacterium]
MQRREWDGRGIAMRAKPQRGGPPMHRTMAVPLAAAATAPRRPVGAPFVVFRAFALGLVFWALLLFAISIAPDWALGRGDSSPSSGCADKVASCAAASETPVAGTPELIGY